MTIKKCDKCDKECGTGGFTLTIGFLEYYLCGDCYSKVMDGLEGKGQFKKLAYDPPFAPIYPLAPTITWYNSCTRSNTQ
jgi:hypothetical protein